MFDASSRQQTLQQLPPAELIRQRNINPLREPPPDRLVQLVGAVGGPEDHHSGLAVRARSVQLHQELCLDASGGLVLLRGPLAQQRVHLVDEHHRRLSGRRHAEESAHRLLSLADPLARQGRRADAEERGLGLMRDGFANQSLAFIFYITTSKAVPFTYKRIMENDLCQADRRVGCPWELHECLGIGQVCSLA